jgi:hypothetical protein
LDAGRLRQGWGSKPEHDLRRLRRRLDASAKLTDEEAAVWRNRRLLDTERDGLRPDDVVIVPNIPDQGRWAIVRVVGPYHYEPPEPGVRTDYGHVVPVEPFRTADGKLAVIEADNENVDARLRASMRSMSRMWSLDAFSGEVEALLGAISRGDDTRTVQSDAAKVAKLVNALHKSALKTILSLYKGAEFERLVQHVFTRLYPKARVDRKGGRGEHGADLLVSTTTTDGLPRKIAVQVKLHLGEDDDLQSLHQIERARSKWGAAEGVIVTTATKLSPRFIEHHDVLAERLGMQIRVITGEEFTRLVMIHVAGVDAREWTS